MRVLEDTEKWSQLKKGWRFLLSGISLTDINWQSWPCFVQCATFNPQILLKFQQQNLKLLVQ